LIASLKEGGVLCADRLSEIIYNTTFAWNPEGTNSNSNLERIGLRRLMWNVYQKVRKIKAHTLFSQLKSLRHEEYIAQEKKYLLQEYNNSAKFKEVYN
jgi:hypothetical protein